MTIREILEHGNVEITSYNAHSNTYKVKFGGVTVYVNEHYDGLYRLSDKAETYKSTQDAFMNLGAKTHRTAWHSIVDTVPGITETISHCLVKDNIEDIDLADAVHKHAATIADIQSRVNNLAKPQEPEMEP